MRAFNASRGMLWALLWLILILTALVSRPLIPIDETRYVSVAWEMWCHGSFLVPQINGIPYSHKPPLFFWLIHLGWWLFGINSWTARLTAPFFGLLDLGLTAYLGRLLWRDDPRVARLAPFVVLGMLSWAIFCTVTMFDMVLTFFVLVAALGVVYARQGKGPIGWGLVGVAIGGGVLTKGPVVLLHVLPIVLLGPWWIKDKPAKPWWRWYTGAFVSLCIGIGIAMAWAFPAAKAGGPEYANAILWTQTAGRVVTSFAHGRPVWWYLAVLPVVLFPWSLCMCSWRGLRRIPFDEGTRMCLSWAVPGIVALSVISGKQIYYILPLLIPAGLLITRAVVILPAPFSRKNHWPVAAVFILVGIGLAVLPLMASHLRELASFRNMSGILGIFPVALGVWILSWRPAGAESLLIRLCSAVIMLVVFVHLGPFRVVKPAYDVTILADRIAQVQNMGKTVANFGKYDDQYHFSGRLEKPLTVLMSQEAVKNWIMKHPEDYVVVYCKHCALELFAHGAEYVQRYRGMWAALWKASALAASPGALGIIQGA